MSRFLSLVVLLGLACSGCTGDDPGLTGALADQSDERAGSAVAAAKAPLAGMQYERLVRLVDDVNEKLNAGGSSLRLDYPWMFTVGPGTDPFAQLRHGGRWTRNSLTYALDDPDYTKDVASADVDAALVNAFQTWNEVARSHVDAQRIANPGGNVDLLDGTIVKIGDVDSCLTIFDVFSPTLVKVTAEGIEINPPSDIYVGGWLDPIYFTACLGSPTILGVTWTFLDFDQNGDNYLDVTYVEQFYNEGFKWGTTGSRYLDFSANAVMDIETIALHEQGHALGLGHFGGPVNLQPFKLKPNGRVFNPEAVMNAFYLGGEQRSLLPTDIAGITTLYAGHRRHTGR